jgi:hypothetical protein
MIISSEILILEHLNSILLVLNGFLKKDKKIGSEFASDSLPF